MTASWRASTRGRLISLAAFLILFVLPPLAVVAGGVALFALISWAGASESVAVAGWALGPVLGGAVVYAVCSLSGSDRQTSLNFAFAAGGIAMLIEVVTLAALVGMYHSE